MDTIRPPAPLAPPTVQPASELRRLAVVRSLHLLDTVPEERFDRIVRLAQELFDVPVVAVNLIDEHREFCKAWVGPRTGDIPLSESLCVQTIDSDGTARDL